MCRICVSGRVAAVSTRYVRPVDMSAVIQEGRSVGLKDHALVLAPVGEAGSGPRVLWLKSRSLHTWAPFQDCLGPISGAVRDYDDDDGWGW